jgi:hypothetical protein
VPCADKFLRHNFHSSLRTRYICVGVDKEEKALGSLRESIPDRIREGGSSTYWGLLLAEDETHGGGCSPAIPLLQEATRSGEKESRNPSFGLVEEDEQKRRRRGLIRRQRQERNALCSLLPNRCNQQH